MPSQPPMTDTREFQPMDTRHGLRGLAELAFGSLTRADKAVPGQHLALLQVESLELDLSDPAQRQFGDYELLELVGEGGMGAVYRARHLPLDRIVAVKLLSAGPWASRDFVARFEREAQNAARMQHPNIVTVFEAGNHDGLHFFSMRLVEGHSLSALLKRGERYTPKAAAALMRTVAEAVVYAHSLGVLHLDLKPGNVLIDEHGTPHVADFGLARRLDSALAAVNDEVSGTPSYMAPEQARVRSSRLTAATDVWGLGAILYELLTGMPPFRAESAQATLKLVQEGQVRSPRRLQPQVPLDLQAIVLRCLARDPNERYPSTRALADDLARFVEGRPVHARPLNVTQRAWRWAKREPKLAITAACAVAALTVGLVVSTQQWLRAEGNAHTARDNLWASRAQTAQQAIAEGNGFRGLRPLVANLAEMETTGRTGEAKIERERIGTILASAPQLLDVLPLPNDEQATSIAIAPDARHFAVATIAGHLGGARHVRQYDLATLRETWSVFTDDRSFLMAGGDRGAPHGGLRYTADGRFLTVSMVQQPVLPAPRRSDMIAFDVRDGSVLWPRGLGERQTDIVYDDSLRIALVRFQSDKSLRWPDSAQFYEVAGWRLVGPRHTVATSLAADSWLPAPNGRAWLGSRDSARLALYDVPSLKPRWQLSLPQTSLVRAWQFSHDGRRIALGSVDGAVRLVDATTGRATELATGPGARVQMLEFDPDDRVLAAIDENGQLWTWDVATGASRSAPLGLVGGGIGAALVRFGGGTVFGGGDWIESMIAYASLTPRAPFNNEAVPGAVRLPGRARFGAVFDVSAAADRLVTAGGGNLIEIWRLPVSPLREERAAPLLPWRQTFDGTRVVAVEGDTVSVVDVVKETPLSPSLRFPEPVRFAELSPDGRALVTIAGRTVRVIDTSSWQMRGAPILLPQTPQRVVFASAAPVLVLTTSEYKGDVLRERIHRIDLARGVLADSDASVDAPEQIEVDPLGRHVLIMTWNTVSHDEAGPLYLALDSGKVACSPALVGVRSFAFAPDGNTAWFDVALNGQSSLRRWDLGACRELAAYDRRQRATYMSALVALGDGGVIAHHASKEALLRIGPDGRRQSAVGEAVAAAMYDFALSRDGERAAFATRNAVHLIDARQGRRLSAPLTAPIAGDDAISKLAFSPDGTRLLARTINGRWLFWNLPRTQLDTTVLAQLTRVLDPNPGDALSTAELSALRVRLRLRDAALATQAAGPPANNDAPRVFAPATDTGVDPRFVPLDLRPAINVPMIGKVWSEPFASGDLPTLAQGPQRFLGIDYRIEGGVQLSGGGTATAIGPELRRSAVIAVPGIEARRVHVLAFRHIPMNGRAPSRAFAHVVLIDARGRGTRLTIRTVHDVVTSYQPEFAAVAARIAFSSTDSVTVRSGYPALPMRNVYAVTLDVPPGTGPIRGLRFDVADGPMEAPLLYAVTLERLDAHDPDLGRLP